MRTELAVIGAVLLVIGLFGYTYAQDQQDLASQAEDVISGEDMDWPLIKSLSLAGATLGAILLIIGLLPEDWTDRRT
ncbi:hypothetical protein AQV86_00415 [Nanohaloarchaea archaeon SG9]|nr:hypothetical protein AQV86_00415 [Nanohaloarchaea archaeon SG9]